MSTLHLVLAEAAVELVPEPLWSHPSIARYAKARKKSPRETLLEDSHHHMAMKAAANKGEFADLDRRGRPDILHTTLLVALESRLNKEGRLRIWVHTRDDKLITVAPDLRLQRAQHRFYGLLEQLLATGRVPPDENVPALLAVIDHVTLAAAVKQTEASNVVVFDEGGEETPLAELFAGLQGDWAVVVGAFPTGELHAGALTEARRVALGKEPLVTWTVAAEAVVAFRG